jgi:low affinity Fe/Cu permease
MNEFFRKFANKTSEWTGSPWAFVTAVAIIVAWAITGPTFGYSDTWQLVINTGTTIVTFLMVFLIQNTQNRDAKAMHLKLDELLRGVQGARTGLVDLEAASDEELEKIQKDFERIRRLRETAPERVEEEAQKLGDEVEERVAEEGVPLGEAEQLGREAADEAKRHAA